jgi:hypothetical protein
MEEVGANVNAMTSLDYTQYADDLPPTALPLAIELESDRMVNLTLTPKQVETERDVVVEERLSTVEDSVEGLLDEMMHLQAFKAHPYRYPVIGLMKDIKAVNADKALPLLPDVLRAQQRRRRRGGPPRGEGRARRHRQQLRQAPPIEAAGREQHAGAARRRARARRGGASPVRRSVRRRPALPRPRRGRPPRVRAARRDPRGGPSSRSTGASSWRRRSRRR